MSGLRGLLLSSVMVLYTVNKYAEYLRNTSSAANGAGKIESVSSCLAYLNNWHRCCLPKLNYCPYSTLRVLLSKSVWPPPSPLAGERSLGMTRHTRLMPPFEGKSLLI
jgi:hypothetical protein